METTTTEAELITPEVRMQGSITSIIGMLFHLRPGSNTYKAVLGQLLKHEDLRYQEDLCHAADRFADDMHDRINEFRCALHDEAKALA
jgi:hypothetical protein